MLLAVLGGLFAMHGLGGHGTAHHGSGSLVAASAAPSAPSGHDTHAAPRQSGPSAPDDGSLADGSPPDGSLSGYAALCLALLAAGSILGRRAGRRGLAVLLPRPRPAPRLVWPPAARRDRDPPSLTRLSINRC